MSDTENTTTPKLPTESEEEVAARQIAAVVPDGLQTRLEALRHRSAELLRILGPQVLDLLQEMAAVETAVNEAFCTRPGEWGTRYAGTGLDAAGGVLGAIEDLAGDRGDVEQWRAAFAEVAQ